MCRSSGDVVVPGWRNRRTGTVHLRAECPAFERTSAEDVENVTIDLGNLPTKRCRWCWNEGRL